MKTIKALKRIIVNDSEDIKSTLRGMCYNLLAFCHWKESIVFETIGLEKIEVNNYINLVKGKIREIKEGKMEGKGIKNLC